MLALSRTVMNIFTTSLECQCADVIMTYGDWERAVYRKTSVMVGVNEIDIVHCSGSVICGCSKRQINKQEEWKRKEKLESNYVNWFNPKFTLLNIRIKAAFDIYPWKIWIKFPSLLFIKALRVKRANPELKVYWHFVVYGVCDKVADLVSGWQSSSGHVIPNDVQLATWFRWVQELLPLWHTPQIPRKRQQNLLQAISPPSLQRVTIMKVEQMKHFLHASIFIHLFS